MIQANRTIRAMWTITTTLAAVPALLAAPPVQDSPPRPRPCGASIRSTWRTAARSRVAWDWRSATGDTPTGSPTRRAAPASRRTPSAGPSSGAVPADAWVRSAAPGAPIDGRSTRAASSSSPPTDAARGFLKTPERFVVPASAPIDTTPEARAAGAAWIARAIEAHGGAEALGGARALRLGLETTQDGWTHRVEQVLGSEGELLRRSTWSRTDPTRTPSTRPGSWPTGPSSTRGREPPHHESRPGGGPATLRTS